MSKLLLIGVLALFIAQKRNIPRDEQTAMTWMSLAFGREYVTKITDTHLANSPKWSGDADNPPISARMALDAATKMKESLVKDGPDFKWELGYLTLRPAPSDRWVWIVRFEARGESSGRPHALELVVTMNGTVIKPEVSPWPPRRKNDRGRRKSAN